MRKHIIKSSVALFLALMMMGTTVFAGEPSENAVAPSDSVEFGDQDENKAQDETLSDETGDGNAQIGIQSEDNNEKVGNISISAENLDISYQAHCQDYGWFPAVKASQSDYAGITGRCKRMEALKISVIGGNSDYNSQISYSVHAQNIGWMEAVSGGQLGGTEGEARRLEAIKITLSGDLAQNYDIYYQVHAQNYGWLGWAKNGEIAGTTGYAYRLEAIRIKLVKKGQTGYSSDIPSYYSKSAQAQIRYSAHVQNIGWMDYVSNGAMAGTQGRCLRMEALKVELLNPTDKSGNPIDGSVSVETHVHLDGWKAAVTDGAVAGTEGECKAIQAVKMKLTGTAANYFDIYYRVHCANFGTLGWAKNGEMAGTTGYAKEVQSIEIRVVAKDSSEAPAQSEASGANDTDFSSISVASYAANVNNPGWLPAVANNEDSGLPNSAAILTQIKMSVTSTLKGGISYQVHVKNVGWMDAVSDGTVTGNGTDQIEAIKINLTGDLVKFYDVYYKTNVAVNGWLGWAKNGQIAGSTGIGYALKAVQVYVKPKYTAAPGILACYLVTKVDEETVQDDQLVWDYLYAQIGNPYGVAGLMGNLYAESGIISNNVENRATIAYPELTDANYTIGVNDGTYTAFTTDRYGYGLAQWTSEGRKTALKKYSDSQGTSISNLSMQLSYLMQELNGEYKAVLNILKTATTVKEASDAVLTKFEMPKDQSDTVKEKRAGYGQTYYDKYAEKEEEQGV